MNLIEPILRHARLQPDAVAIIDDERAITYGELAPLVLRTAAHLAALGVKPGHRVALALKDHWQHVVALLAVGRMGAIMTPLDWRAKAAEQAQVARVLEVDFALVEPGSRASLPCPVIPIDDAWRRGVATATPWEEVPGDWNAPLLIAQTSGTTTGAPKFLLKTHLNFYFTIIILLELLALPKGSRLLSTRPLYFGSARQRSIAHLFRGDSVVIHSALVSAAEYVALVRRHNANVGSIGPPFLRQLIALGADKEPLLPGMRALCCGGSLLGPEDKLAAARIVTPNFFENYSTAATGVIAMLRPEDVARRPTSVGRPHPLVALEAVDEEHRPLAMGATGRMRYRSPSVGRGLMGPGGWEGASEGFHDGWYYPGEYISFDEEGFVFAHGRTAEVITRGTVKVHPPEIEQLLCRHAAVAEAAVVGRPTADDNEVVAFVVGRAPVEGGELMAYCRTHLAPYKVPQHIFVIPEMPRNDAGKIEKAELRRRLAEGFAAG
jgi:long-chain acyl-CoA synthetase